MTFNTFYLVSLLHGLWGTVLLSVLTFLFGGLLGALISLCRISPSRAVRGTTGLYIEIVQGVPLLVLMGLCFYGPSFIGVQSVTPLMAATLAMSINSSSYLGEIWRSCLQTVPRAQWEAAECLGLTRWQRMRMVVSPQALRLATPPTVGFMVTIIKNTSVASLVVGFAELSFTANVLNNATFRPFIVFGVASLLYLALCFPLSQQARLLERRLNVGRR